VLDFRILLMADHAPEAALADGRLVRLVAVNGEPVGIRWVAGPPGGPPRMPMFVGASAPGRPFPFTRDRAGRWNFVLRFWERDGRLGPPVDPAAVFRSGERGGAAERDATTRGGSAGARFSGGAKVTKEAPRE